MKEVLLHHLQYAQAKRYSFISYGKKMFIKWEIITLIVSYALKKKNHIIYIAQSLSTREIFPNLILLLQLASHVR